MAITRDMYKKMLNADNMGRAIKNNSEMVKEATFTNDIQYQVGYFCDYYHTLPENRLKIDGIDPSSDPNYVPIELRFIAHSQKTYEKDEVTMHIEFRPSHVCPVDYYEEVFGSRYNAEYPVGLYVWLNENGKKYHRWLVVATADAHEHIFPTYEVLRCTDVYRWVKNGKLYEVPGVARSQSSYNSGLWRDYRFQQVEDQTKFALPLNRDTEHLFYNTRIIIDAPVLTEPRAWLISKINREVSRGVVVFTAAQDLFNEFTDVPFYKDNGDVDFWIADWKQTAVTPENIIQDDDSLIITVTPKITVSGKTSQLKIGGSKIFTVTFYEDDQIADHDFNGEWLFLFGDEDASNLFTLSYPSENQVKAQFTGDDAYIGRILTVKYICEDVTASLDVEIIAL